MFNHRHYVPILKLKRGERNALTQLFPADKPYVTPLLEIAETEYDPPSGNSSDSAFDLRIAQVGGHLAGCWGTQYRLFLDGYLIDPVAVMGGGLHPMAQIFNDARLVGVQAVPVTAPGRDPLYQAAIASILNIDNRGVVIRLTMEHLNDPSLGVSINGLLRNLRVTPPQCDLVIDLGEVSAQSGQLLLAVSYALNQLPYLLQWRSFTLAAGAFPSDLSMLVPGIGHLPRSDWLLYHGIIANSLSRVPAFGDYACRNPALFDGDPRVINASASIRYTIDQHWLVVRGYGTRTPGAGGFQQFCANAATLVSQPTYCGSAFSVGDQDIQDIGSRSTNCGNLETWVRIGVNHHITFAARQILAIPSSPTFL